MIVLGESKIEEQLEKATERANKLIEKQIDADADELEREIEAAAKEEPRPEGRRSFHGPSEPEKTVRAQPRKDTGAGSAPERSPRSRELGCCSSS